MRAPRILPLAAGLLLAVAGCGGDDDNGGAVTPIPYSDDGKLQVMTRNLYLGADLTPILTATTQNAFVQATTNVWLQVQANNAPASPGGPPARLVAVADEIANAKPDLVGLQEVSLWRTQTPGDAAAGGTTPATTIVYDYLATLLAALSARGLDYVAVKELDLVDLEAPTIGAGGTIDVRLTDRDVILARRGVTVANARGDVFSAASLGAVSVLGQPFAVKRGWEAVDATIGGKQLTFASTHLEAFDLPIPGGGLARPAQTAELVAALAGVTGPLVLVGDMNAAPGVSGDSHDLLTTSGGFSDAWDLAGAGPGPTCCFAESLADPSATLTTRIDDVLLRPGSGTLTAATIDVVGDATGERTSNGLWHSDHAGVIATINP